MEARYIAPENMRELAGDTFELTAASADIELAERERAKLYLEAENLMATPAFYWFTDAKEPADFPVAGPADFTKVEGEDSYRLSVNVSDELSERRAG